SIHMDAVSLLDFNRAGTPLIEIVSAPEMHSAEEAYLYLTTLKRNLSYLGISSLSMEKGALRCDINLSLRPEGETALPNYKVEVKNLNSFAGAKAAIAFEIERQTKLLEAGKQPAIETRMWNEAEMQTVSMRSKEGANDYRFFPEPDLPQFRIDRDWVESIRAAMPEMPSVRLGRMTRDYGIDEDKAELIVDDPASAEFLDACVALKADPKKVANWMVGGLAKVANDRSCAFGELPITPEQLVGLIELLDQGKLNNITAQEVLLGLLESEDSALEVAKSRNKLIEGDEGEVDSVIEEVLQEFAKAAAELAEGKDQTLGFLIGQCMRKLKGRANPKDLGPNILAKVRGG
ncbi:MAG: Asp-tRNA(Asn)/Glu-tRNA(Gln) amidotransferase subunit GatB, partial [Planctomycetes bacterium]|nr:Asp-tRNA(Asn)/Glu-tRNA(Gln) amidotransferase subunit GatB [Planctomycetota bacterium]